jgi:hypothetical protein
MKGLVMHRCPYGTLIPLTNLVSASRCFRSLVCGCVPPGFCFPNAVLYPRRWCWEQRGRIELEAPGEHGGTLRAQRLPSATRFA